MKKRVLCWLLALIVVIVIILLLIFLLHRASEKPNDVIGTTENNNISIPGYEGLTLKADTEKQRVSLSNPKENNCYFKIELFLEDGTLLWTSDYIKPGKTSERIKLNKALPKGSYPNAILRYSCFKMNEERTPLNGAEIKLTLWVK